VPIRHFPSRSCTGVSIPHASGLQATKDPGPGLFLSSWACVLASKRLCHHSSLGASVTVGNVAVLIPTAVNEVGLASSSEMEVERCRREALAGSWVIEMTLAVPEASDS